MSKMGISTIRSYRGAKIFEAVGLGTSYLYDSPEGLRCEDSTDYLLPVVPGDCLSIVARTGEMGTLVKKNGVTGWYQGRLNDETKRETKGT